MQKTGIGSRLFFLRPRNRPQFGSLALAAGPAGEDFAPCFIPADLPLIGKRVQHSHQTILIHLEIASAVTAWISVVAHTRYELKIAEFVQQWPYR
jgi:hypothetical protein